MKLRPPIEVYENLDDEIEQHLKRIDKEDKIKKKSSRLDHFLLQNKKRK